MSQLAFEILCHATEYADDQRALLFYCLELGKMEIDLFVSILPDCAGVD